MHLVRVHSVFQVAAFVVCSAVKTQVNCRIPEEMPTDKAPQNFHEKM